MNEVNEVQISVLSVLQDFAGRGVERVEYDAIKRGCVGVNDLDLSLALVLLVRVGLVNESPEDYVSFFSLAGSSSDASVTLLSEYELFMLNVVLDYTGRGIRFVSRSELFSALVNEYGAGLTSADWVYGARLVSGDWVTDLALADLVASGLLSVHASGSEFFYGFAGVSVNE